MTKGALLNDKDLGIEITGMLEISLPELSATCGEGVGIG